MENHNASVGKILLQSGGVSTIEAFQVRMAAADQHIRVKNGQWEPGTEFVEPEPFMPVGSVEFCRAAMAVQGFTEPDPLDYPNALKPWMPFGGPVRTTYTDMPQGWTPENHQGIHGKPVVTKLDPGLWKPETPFWASPYHRFGPEYRFYVLRGEIVGCGRYDDREDDPDEPLFLDMAVVLEMIAAYQKAGAPAGYALDVGVSDEDGMTRLVEVNDGWALGFYRGSLHRSAYLELLIARWQEMSRQEIGQLALIGRIGEG